MNKILLLLTTAFLFTNCSDQKQVENNELTFGKIDRVYTKVLSEERTVYVLLPEDAEKFSDVKYPALYLLDGH